MWPFARRPTPLDFAQTAGAIYADLVASELADEWSRKESLEQRGQRLFANVLLIAGVVFSIGSFALGNEVSSWPSLPTEFVAFAAEGFIFLLGAAGLGIRVGWPRSYETFAVDELRRLTREQRLWTGRKSIAVLRTTEGRIALLATAREINHDKAWGLTYGTLLELFAIVLLAIAVAIFFVRGPVAAA